MKPIRHGFERTLRLALLALCAACHAREAPSSSSTASALVEVERSEKELGPVKVVAELSPKKPRLSDEPTLTLTIDSAEGVEVKLPPFGESVGGFLIRDFREPPVERKDGRRIQRQIYRLEPVTAGKQVILPIPVKFTDARKEGDGKEHSLETEALTIEVTSSVGDKTPSFADLRSAAGPKDLPREPLSGGWYAAGATFVVLCLGLAWWWKRRPSPIELEKVLTPTELAHLELERLLQADPLGRGEVKTFYVELTLIVRRFIERTTSIRAPEQTTHEFLALMQASGAFDAEKKRQLRDFLESADLVKFAAHEPSAHDIESSFERAKRFVGLAPAAGVAA